MNCLKITNLTQEILLRPAFRLLKGTRSNYAELEYDFEECYKAFSEKLDWENPEGVPVDFFNNDLKYLQGGVSTMTYTTSITKTKAAQYDLPGIEDMTFYGYARGLQSTHDVYSTKRILAVTQVEIQRSIENVHQKLGYSEASRRSSNGSGKLLEEDQRHQARTTKSSIRKRDPYTPYQDPHGFIYVNNNGRNRLMRSDELYKFSDRTLTGLQTSLDDSTKNIRMEYLPKRRWSTLEKKRVNIMIKAINKQLKERRMMRSLDKFVSGRYYGTDLQLLQQKI
ncbi:hypothetical protein Tco_1187741 [Tanacetum coccineum]